MQATDSNLSLKQLLGLASEPVTVTFRDEAPAGIARAPQSAPAGCSYWRLAAEGPAFYTVAEDHLNCPIGAYTHGAELPSATAGELQGMIGMMVGIQYLRMDEVPAIPRRAERLRFVIYAPLGATPENPDVVLIRGNARQIMLVAEAAQARNLLAEMPVMGRPACAVVAASMATGKVVTSLGCIGNRVYTELADGELYIAVPGQHLDVITDTLQPIVAANSQLEQFHRSRSAAA